MSVPSLRLGLLCVRVLHVRSIDKCVAFRTYLIYKFHRFFLLDTTNRADFLVIEKDTVEFIRRYEHLWPECCRDKLA